MKKILIVIFTLSVLISSIILINSTDTSLEDEKIKVIKNKTLRDELRSEDSIKIKDGITKEYISKDKRVKIYDEDNLLDLQLESDYTEVVLGWSDMDLIAWFDLKDFNGSDFVDDVKFYDVNNNYTELIKNYVFKYKERQNISICDEFDKNCEIFEDDVWIEFNLLSELPKKNIEIGLFIDIVSGDKIEWVIEKDGFYILEWAIVVGTNAGFVIEAPNGDPGASGLFVGGRSFVSGFTSPANAVKITEMGWYHSSTTGSGNYEMGLYAADGGVVPGEAGTLLEVDRTNSKGSTSGWKRVTGLNWDIEPSTNYWFAVQNDIISTTIDHSFVSGGLGTDRVSSQTTLENPLSGGAITIGDVGAIYAIYEEAEPEISQSQTNLKDGHLIFKGGRFTIRG